MKMLIALVLVIATACCCAQNGVPPYLFYYSSHMGEVMTSEKKQVSSTVCLPSDKGGILRFHSRILSEFNDWSLLDGNGDPVENKSFDLESGECLDLIILLQTQRPGESSAVLSIDCTGSTGCDQAFNIKAQVHDRQDIDHHLRWIAQFQLPEPATQAFFRENELWVGTENQIRKFRLPRENPDFRYIDQVDFLVPLGEHQICEKNGFLLDYARSDQLRIREGSGEIIAAHALNISSIDTGACPDTADSEMGCAIRKAGCSATGDLYIFAYPGSNVFKISTDKLALAEAPPEIEQIDLALPDDPETTLFGLTQNLVAIASTSMLAVHQMDINTTSEIDSTATGLKGNLLINGHSNRVYLIGTSGTQIARFDVVDGTINESTIYDSLLLGGNRGFALSDEGMIAVLVSTRSGDSLQVFRVPSLAFVPKGSGLIITIILIGVKLFLKG